MAPIEKPNAALKCFMVLAMVKLSSVNGKAVKLSSSIGYFWQVTDFHYDENYTLHGDPNTMCHYSGSSVHYNLGKIYQPQLSTRTKWDTTLKTNPNQGVTCEYGNYRCDSPWALVQSAILAMKAIHSEPDFILWTGDSVPHVDGSTYNEDKILGIVHNVTKALVAQFPNTTILPSFGNHDPYPSNQMPVNDPHYYGSILKVSHWDTILNESAFNTFLKGGYYAYEVSPSVKVISLNTALYYSFNSMTNASTNEYDPSGQIAWLASQLEMSRLFKQKVYIAAHVPPGSFELVPSYKWFHDDLNNKYLDVVEEFHDVISGQFYGHEHTDSFRVFNIKDGGSSPMFLSPSVTPWKSSLPGMKGNNPSIRLYKYDKTTSDILDYQQYFLNLTQANQGDVEWKLEYEFTKAYDVADLKSSSVKKASQNILSDDKYLSRYVTYNFVSVSGDNTCNSTCKHNHRCVILNLRYDELTKCLSPEHHRHHSTTTPKHSTHHHHHPQKVPKYMTWIIAGLAVTLILLAIAVMIMCFRPREYVLVGRGYGRVPSYGAVVERAE